MNFFITGLPRSRTSWFASFMSSGDIFCHHEAMNRCKSTEEFYEKLKLPYRLVGDADCGLAYSDFQKLNSPTLIIHRDKHEVLESLISSGITNDRSVINILTDLESRLLDLKGLHVRFEEIDSRLYEIYYHLTGDQVDENRVKLFTNMNIQPIDTSGDPESLRIWLCRS